MIGALIAAVGAIGTGIGVGLKYLIDRQGHALRDRELLHTERSDFHKEVRDQLEAALGRERQLIDENRELRSLLWRAIPVAEESLDEAEHNIIQFTPGRQS